MDLLTSLSTLKGFQLSNSCSLRAYHRLRPNNALPFSVEFSRSTPCSCWCLAPSPVPHPPHDLASCLPAAHVPHVCPWQLTEDTCSPQPEPPLLPEPLSLRMEVGLAKPRGGDGVRATSNPCCHVCAQPLRSLLASHPRCHAAVSKCHADTCVSMLFLLYRICHLIKKKSTLSSGPFLHRHKLIDTN